MSFNRVGVIGAGAWGTALALCAARAGRDVALWGRDAEAMALMQSARCNAHYLPEISWPESLHASSDAARLETCDLLLAVVPAQHLGACLKELKPHLPHAPLLICAKGIELPGGTFLSDHVAQILPQNTTGFLSGPGFAGDVALGLPTALSIAFADENLAKAAAQDLSAQNFRLYHGSDVRGVEIGGALKNVFAIASGIVTGKGLGASARAALIARSFAEMQRFGVANGAKLETFSGLSGLGDLVLSATSEQSRNFRYGLALGQAGDMQEARQRLGTVEGIATAEAALKHAARQNIDMPVAQAVANVTKGAEGVDEAITRLMSRPLKSEHEWRIG